MRQSCNVFSIDLPCRIVQIQFVIRIQQIHIRFPQRIDRTDVFPVTFELVGVESLAFAKEVRNDVLSEIVLGIRILHIGNQHLAKRFPVEDIDTHRRKIALRVFRLLFEINDTACFVCIHDTKTACFLHRYADDCDGRVGIVCFMLGKHLGIIHFIDMVSGKYKQIFRRICINKINIL